MDGILFKDREAAGRALADAYDGPREDVTVFGIARGGIPIAYPIAMDVGGELDVITARKLPVPWSPESGFGAIAPDGSMVLNPEMTPGLGLSAEEIDGIGEQVLEEVRRRERVYRGGGQPARIEGKNVVIADDGLATGYTMIASIQMVRKAKAKWVACAVPVSPADTAERVSPMVDDFICLHVVRAYSFAVASFYRDFHDMKDSEVLDVLEKARRGKARKP
jgi:putative phosphoribosyl transferase